MSSKEVTIHLGEILRDQVLPWLNCDEPAILVAHSELRARELPASVRLSRKKLRGRRRAMRGSREHGNVSVIVAFWPEDRLVELRSGAKLGAVIEGEADLQIGDKILHCPAGTFLFFPPGVPHPDGKYPHLEGDRQKSEDEFCRMIWFEQRGCAVECWICHSRGARHWAQQSQEEALIPNDRAMQLLRIAQAEALEKQRRHEQIVPTLLQALIRMLLREFEDERYLHAPRHETHTPATALADPIAEARQYIRSNLRQRLTIDQVAREIHMSRAQFTKRFRMSTGQSFSQFHN